MMTMTKKVYCRRSLTGLVAITHNPIRKGYHIKINKFTGTARTIDEAIEIRKKLIERNRMETGLTIIPVDRISVADFKKKEKELRAFYFYRKTQRKNEKTAKKYLTDKKDRAVKPPEEKTVAVSNTKFVLIMAVLMAILVSISIGISQIMAH